MRRLGITMSRRGLSIGVSKKVIKLILDNNEKDYVEFV